MKHMMLILLCAALIAAGGVSVYLYLDTQQEKDYSNGLFVDRGDHCGYATMYDLLKDL